MASGDTGEARGWSRRASAACTVVGAACLWAWGYIANLSAALFPDVGIVESIGIEFAYYTSQLMIVALAVVLAIVLRHRHPGLPPALVVGAGVALGLASAAVAALMRLDGAPVAAVVACGLVYGVAGLALTVAWGARFSLGSSGARRLVLLSFLLAYAIYLVSNCAPSWTSLAFACLLPVLSALLWLLDSWRRHLLTAEVWPAKRSAVVAGGEGVAGFAAEGAGGAGLPDLRRGGVAAVGGAARAAECPDFADAACTSQLGEVSAGSVDSRLLPWRTMGLFAVAALVGNYVSSLLMGATYQGAAVIFPAGFLVCAIITFAAFLLVGGAPGRLSVERLFRYCLPFSVLGMLMLLVAPAGSEGFPGALVVGASLFLQVLVVLKVTEATQETGMSPLLSFSAGQGVIAAMVALGNVGGRLTSNLPDAAQTVLPLVCALGVFILFYLLVMVTDGMAEKLLASGLNWEDEDDLQRGGGPAVAGERAGHAGFAGDSPEGAQSPVAGERTGRVGSVAFFSTVSSCPTNPQGAGRPAAPASTFEHFAQRLGLTPREAQVCVYLVQGRSLPYIAEQLLSLIHI